MTNPINHMFSFDAGISNWEEVIEHHNMRPEDQNKSVKHKDDRQFLSSATTNTIVKTMDSELEDIFLSLINDMERLRRDSFDILLKKTRLSIEMKLKNIQDPNTQQALSDLINLLDESAGLVSLFHSYTNWLQKG
jgi:hypothetical protein